MDFITDILNFVIVFFVSFGGFFLVTIIHEFGHAIFILIFTKGEVKIKLGGGTDSKHKIKLGRVSINFNGANTSYGVVYGDYDPESITKIQRIMICLGGPIFSILIIIVSVILGIFVNNDILKFIFKILKFASVIQLFCTLIPITYPNWWYGYGGSSSDGLNALNILRENKVGSN